MEPNHSPPKQGHISGLAELAKITAVDAKTILLVIHLVVEKNKYKRKEYIKMLSKSVYLSVIVIAAIVLLVTAQMVANHQASAYYYHGKHYRYYHNGKYYNQRFPVGHYYCYGSYAYCYR